MSKSPLLKETIARRMLKLANIGTINTENFINETYEPLDEDKAYTAKKEKPGADIRKGAEKRGAEGTLAKTPGHGKVDYVKEGGAKKGDQSATHLDYMEEGGDLYEDDDESMGDPSKTHPGELDYEGDMEDDLAADEEAAMDLEGGGKEEKFKEIVDMLADLLDVEADVELEGGELEAMEDEGIEDDLEPPMSAVDMEGGETEVEDEEEIIATEGALEEDLMEALTARVTERITKMQEAKAQAKARKEQIAESVADRIMKRLES